MNRWEKIKWWVADYVLFPIGGRLCVMTLFLLAFLYAIIKPWDAMKKVGEALRDEFP